MLLAGRWRVEPIRNKMYWRTMQNDVLLPYYSVRSKKKKIELGVIFIKVCIMCDLSVVKES
jgi:hypothetical protein